MAIIGVALARNADTARKIIIRFQCDTSANVGDFVYQDPSNDTKVLVNSDNNQTSPTIGVIDSKPDTQIAEVLVLGVKAGFSGLSRGGKVFLSSSGTATNTKPVNGYVHILGVATSSSEMLVIPNSIRTKLI